MFYARCVWFFCGWCSIDNDNSWNVILENVDRISNKWILNTIWLKSNWNVFYICMLPAKRRKNSFIFKKLWILIDLKCDIFARYISFLYVFDRIIYLIICYRDLYMISGCSYREENVKEIRCSYVGWHMNVNINAHHLLNYTIYNVQEIMYAPSLDFDYAQNNVLNVLSN